MAIAATIVFDLALIVTAIWVGTVVIGDAFRNERGTVGHKAGARLHARAGRREGRTIEPFATGRAMRT